jgi:hypothetical protein
MDRHGSIRLTRLFRSEKRRSPDRRRARPPVEVQVSDHFCDYCARSTQPPSRAKSRASSEATRAADAIPNARIEVLDGHGHFARKTDLAIVTTLVRQFIAH